MIGGIRIKRNRKGKFIIYEALLLTGIAGCMYGLFLLFFIFIHDANFMQVSWLEDLNQKNFREDIQGEYTKVTSNLDQKLYSLDREDIDIHYIELLTIHSALQNFKEAKHDYPKSLETLTSEYPNNYLSVIPEGTRYTLIGDRYELFYRGYQISSNQKEKIELHFYPVSNELVVAIANLPLARYPVASGKDPLPFKESKIEQRVKDPNGGTGAVGTRGLVLQDQYAIHGTNNPSSIGNYLTLGCIRLYNESIESLYSYIPLGTSFKVKTGNVSSPVFSHRFPDFTSTNSLSDKVSNEERTTNTPGTDSKGYKNFDKINGSLNNRICECNPKKTFQWRS